MNGIGIAESGYLPDTLIRFGIRKLLKQRLLKEGKYDSNVRSAKRVELLEDLNTGPVAIATEQANEQHYEVPAKFFELALGPHLKYSSALWLDGTQSLAEAELNMLKCYVERAELENGQDVLELGCGWGSLSLHMAELFPDSRITAISNSVSQKAFIDAKARERNLCNLVVITADVNHFSTDARYDRVVSVEMLEHVRNYAVIFERISRWLRPNGAMFAHIFCHDHLLYPFEVEGEEDWMAQYFFTGGMMPSYDTFTEFQQHLTLNNCWRVPGTHYQHTADAWLENSNRHKQEMLQVLAECYGDDHAALWWQRWRIFFMACSELFAYNNGEEWLVGHYLWHKA